MSHSLLIWTKRGPYELVARHGVATLYVYPYIGSMASPGVQCAGWTFRVERSDDMGVGYRGPIASCATAEEAKERAEAWLQQHVPFDNEHGA